MSRRTVRAECLDLLLILNRRHLERLLPASVSLPSLCGGRVYRVEEDVLFQHEPLGNLRTR